MSEHEQLQQTQSLADEARADGTSSIHYATENTIPNQANADQQHNSLTSSEVGVNVAMMEPRDISVRVSGSPVKDYYAAMDPVGINVVGADIHASHSSTKAQKRTSLNHYMIESSITEEIREENYSEKTSSDKTSNAGGSPMMQVHEDHVIVREGITSMFQHSASR